ncbi:MAG: DNA gyrase inhibitor YacG [Rhodomicrobium sp.]
MADEDSGTKPGKATPPSCVICHLRPQTEKYQPFCSKRCADIDLHRWLGEVYTIPILPDEEDGASPAGRTLPDGDGD